MASAAVQAARDAMRPGPDAERDAARKDAEAAPPTKEQVEALERNGNACLDADWSKVLVRPGCDLGLVRGCTFKGQVVLGALDRHESLPSARGLPPRVANSTLWDCRLGDNVFISNCELICKTWVGAGATLAGCGVVSKSGKGAFGNGTSIPVALGTGGRDVLAYAHLVLEEASQVAANRSDEALQAAHKSKVRAFVAEVECEWNIIEAGARVEGASLVEDVYLGPHAKVAGSRLQSATVLSTAQEPSRVLGGSDVRNAVLQHDVLVDSLSIVDGSVMLCNSHAERHGKLLESVLGPFSGVAEGEISSSLVGPFVGFHHQALLIASFWPAGRGNVGYGANVGSNHTGKAPDQELWPGEGVFFGLSSSIKFPSDFSRAPYSLVATGVTTLPQRVTMPFSLIASPSRAVPGLSVAINEIFPGWMLSQNIYSVLRNEHKFRTRGAKSLRVDVDFRVFRPHTMAMVRCARDALASPAVVRKDVYTDRDFAGLGKNYMTHEAREEAIRTYTYFLVYYAVSQGVWPRLAAALASGALLDEVGAIDRDLAAAPADYARVEPTPDLTLTGMSHRSETQQTLPGQDASEWALQSAILAREARGVLSLEADATLRCSALLMWLKGAKLELAESALESKLKDERRGEKIIPGYVEAHGAVATTDALVLRAKAEAAELGAQVDACLALMGPVSPQLRGKL